MLHPHCCNRWQLEDPEMGSACLPRNRTRSPARRSPSRYPLAGSRHFSSSKRPPEFHSSLLRPRNRWHASAEEDGGTGRLWAAAQRVLNAGIAAKGVSGSSGVIDTSGTSSARHAGGPSGLDENSVDKHTCVLAYLLRLQLRWQNKGSEQGGG